MRLLHKATKQYNSGPWLGGFKDLASRTIMYLSALSFTQISATFYYTTLKPVVAQHAPWISFGLYFSVLVFLILLIMLLEYKFIVPSSYTFQNWQEYSHQNLIRGDLRKILDRLDEIEKGNQDESRNNKPNQDT